MEKTFSLNQRVQSAIDGSKQGLVVGILQRPKDLMYLVSWPGKDGHVHDYCYPVELDPAAAK